MLFVIALLGMSRKATFSLWLINNTDNPKTFFLKMEIFNIAVFSEKAESRLKGYIRRRETDR